MLSTEIKYVLKNLRIPAQVENRGYIDIHFINRVAIYNDHSSENIYVAGKSWYNYLDLMEVIRLGESINGLST